MTSPDKSYHVSGFALAGMGEMTMGFLVLCIPSLPKLIKSVPILQKLSTRMQSWIGLSSSSQSTSKPNSRLGLPSWIRNQGQKFNSRRRGSDVLFYSEALKQNNASAQPVNVPLPIDEAGEKSGGEVTDQAVKKDDAEQDAFGVEFITVQEV